MRSLISLKFVCAAAKFMVRKASSVESSDSSSKDMIFINTALLFTLWTLVDGQNCTCGKEILNTRIVGGKESRPNQHLWAAALVTSSRNEIFCGGSLINNRYILTAAHCLNPFVEDEIRVALGVHSLASIPHVETVYDVDEIIVHPDYRPDDQYQLNDIGLLKLSRDVDFTSKIQPICLPDESMKINYELRPLLVVGWGKTSENGEYSDKLQEVYLPYVEFEDCVEMFNENLITESHICAGDTKEGAEKDSCNGDSGGALIYWHKPTKGYQLGIVSWGVECGSRKPGVYTKVQSYLDFIDEHTKDAIKCY